VSQPYKLYGSTEIKKLEKIIIVMTNRWFKEWSGSEKKIQSIEIISKIEDVSIFDDLYNMSYCNDDIRIMLAIEKELYQNFPDIILPVNHRVSHGQSSMVKEIMDELFSDLVRPYVKLSGFKNIDKTPLTAEVNIGSEFDLPGNNGALLIKICFEQGFIFLRLPYDILKELNLNSVNDTERKLSLSKRGNCEIKGSVKLTVKVGSAEVDFGSIISMQKGDVIRLDNKITDKMDVVTSDGSFICKAFLGKKNNNKAVKVII